MKSDKPILELIENFVSELDVKPYVRKNQTWVLHRFVTWMTKTAVDVRNPRRADIIHYKNSLLTEGKTPTTVNTYLAPVRTFFQYLENTGIYENIAAGIRSPKDSRDFRKEYLNPEQANQFLNLIPTNTLVGKRDFAMINLMLVYALRRIEILRLKVADLKDERIGPVLYIQRKGRDYKEPILLLPEVFEPIQDYLIARANYSQSEPLFANHSRHNKTTLSETMVSRILKKYLKQVKDSKRLTCHSLRHSTAINLLKAGKSIYDVKELLGHSSVKTTELYLAAIKAETRFNNPLVRELTNIYRKPTKTP